MGLNSVQVQHRNGVKARSGQGDCLNWLTLKCQVICVLGLGIQKSFEGKLKDFCYFQILYDPISHTQRYKNLLSLPQDAL